VGLKWKGSKSVFFKSYFLTEIVLERRGASRDYTNINENVYKTKTCFARSKIFEPKP